ncbi:MAG: protein translocase subunit SecF [Candidatus Babeliales bacterium]
MINFVRYQAIGFLWIIIVCAVAGGMYWFRGGFDYSVDFTGGTEVRLKFENPVSTLQVQTILEQKGWKGVTLREFSSTELVVRVQEYLNDSKGLGQRIVSALNAGLDKNNAQLLSIDSVGASVGANLRSKAMYAFGLSLFFMLIYIAIRFKFAFAVGAVVALFCDAMAILAVYLLMNQQFSMGTVTAILTTLGYSINDTIVIFTRIRDNLTSMRGSSLDDIINVSINQTLTRTMLTSLSTALVVLSMFIFGGPTLKNLSIGLLMGIIFGTFSSVYVASPVMRILYKGKNS